MSARALFPTRADTFSVCREQGLEGCDTWARRTRSSRRTASPFHGDVALGSQRPGRLAGASGTVAVGQSQPSAGETAPRGPRWQGSFSHKVPLWRVTRVQSPGWVTREPSAAGPPVSVGWLRTWCRSRLREGQPRAKLDGDPRRPRTPGGVPCLAPVNRGLENQLLGQGVRWPFSPGASELRCIHKGSFDPGSFKEVSGGIRLRLEGSTFELIFGRR